MLKVMTFNIRYGTATDGDNPWTRRKNLVIERIRSFDPDLLGLQECRAEHRWQKLSLG
ncbi:MAG: endonuclease/exonuclease/phosphatase family protein [Anaerolineae bacterium]|nr:endonuclease/exonuclease/phosphatase family protein [Anaerolineae bacterium]